VKKYVYENKKIIVVGARAARFFMAHDTKTGKIYKINKNVPNGHKIFQMSVKYSEYP
jgi:hypothetical protein